MSLNISEFQIIGLHGRTNVSIEIRDSKIVLVGQNGLGKTTIIDILYALLTRQWQRLARHDFRSVHVTINGESLSLYSHHLAGFNHAVSPRVLAVAQALAQKPSPTQELALRARHDRGALMLLSSELRIPFRIVQEYLDSNLQMDLFEPYDPTPISKIASSLEQLVSGQTLYLPTYRRIERDLKAIFPDMDENIERYRRRRRLQAREDLEHIEFVEFGMEDVELLLSSALDKLRETARATVNRLASQYLVDVIRGQASDYETSKIKQLTQVDIDRVLGRVDDRTITEFDKQEMKKSIFALSRDPGARSATIHDEYIIHFLIKLLDVHESLTRRESEVSQFVHVANSYLRGKQLSFDENAYVVSLQLDDKTPLELSQLSSGEKQIVSLFAQVYLGGETPLTVLIDEPELSLSVSWQKKLLPDIAASSRCQFLAAVTHSPFTFANSFDPYTLDIASCMSRYDEPPRQSS